MLQPGWLQQIPARSVWFIWWFVNRRQRSPPGVGACRSVISLTVVLDVEPRWIIRHLHRRHNNIIVGEHHVGAGCMLWFCNEMSLKVKSFYTFVLYCFVLKCTSWLQFIQVVRTNVSKPAQQQHSHRCRVGSKSRKIWNKTRLIFYF